MAAPTSFQHLNGGLWVYPDWIWRLISYQWLEPDIVLVACNLGYCLN